MLVENGAVMPEEEIEASSDESEDDGDETPISD